jgi:hypothetical protein
MAGFMLSGILCIIPTVATVLLNYVKTMLFVGKVAVL